MSEGLRVMARRWENWDVPEILSGYVDPDSFPNKRLYKKSSLKLDDGYGTGFGEGTGFGADFWGDPFAHGVGYPKMMGYGIHYSDSGAGNGVENK